jgi:RHS repeat-associated protein
VPSAATTGPVVVTVGGVASNNTAYFSIPGPQVNSISPTAGVAGTQVTISGVGFQAVKGSSYVAFNNNASYTLAVSSWSDSQIVGTVPTGATTGPVTVTVNGVGSNPDVLFSLPNPIVSSIVPSSGPVGTQVQINGSGFGASQGTSTVKIYGNALTVNSWSDSQIVVTLPTNTVSGPVQVTVGGNNSNSNIDFTVPAPQITSLSPNNGPVNTQVTVNGSGFQASRGSSQITFNNIAPTLISWSDTQIVAKVPSGATTGPVVVTVNSTSSNQDVVFKLPNPWISGISPTTARVGTQVQVNGSGFGATQVSSTLTFYQGGTTTIVSWSDTQIVAVVPATATTGAVSLTESGVTSNTDVVLTVPPPQITSISPASGNIGTQVTVNGSGLQATQGSSSITFNGRSGTVGTWSDTQIVATIASSTTGGTGPVKVTVNGIASNQDVEFSLPNPNILNTSPASGPVGTPVQINGSGFGATQGSSTITFGGTNASVVSWSDTQIVATAPSAGGGSVIVKVGGVPSNSNVTFLCTSVNVTSVSPKVGPVGTQVTVSGSGFGASQGASTLNFYNGAAATVITSWSDSQIVAPVPSGARTGPVQVTTASATSNNTVSFAVGTMVVTSVSPATVLAGSQFQINGSGFGASQGSSTVGWGGYNPTIVSWSDTQITAVTPPAAGTNPVTVTEGSVTSNADINLIVLGPTVTSISPTSGPVGTQVQINGNNFGATQGSSAVTFYNQTATIVSWSNTQIVATVPVGAPAGLVTVTVDHVPSSGNVYFTVPPPQVTAVSPTSGPSGTQVTITGTGFQAARGNGYVLIAGSYIYSPVSWSDTQIVVNIPTGGATGPVQVEANNRQNSNEDFIFTLPNPVITGLTPSSGPVGTQVQVNGSGFGATQGSSTFGHSGMNFSIVSWSDTQIVATVPSAFTTTVVYVTEGGVTSNTNIYFTVPLAHVASLAPSSGVVGTQVTISGSGFQATQGSSTILFNGVTAAVSSWSDSSIVATVPANTVTGPVTVHVNGLSSNQDVQFTLPNPQIAGLSPTRGAVGMLVQINGSGFGAAEGSSRVVFNNNATATVLSWSNTQIVAEVPTTASTGPVTVVEGGVTSNGDVDFEVPAPQITSLTPNTGGIGNPVTITGTGFQARPGSMGRVQFANGFSTAAITSWSDTQIVAVVPGGTTTGPVQLYAANNQISNVANYTIPALSITNLSPGTGPVGTQVTITGTAFGATQGSSTVTFNGQPAASITGWNNTQIVASVPSSATTGPVAVAVGGVNSNVTLIFNVPAPSISSTTPGGGAAVGTQVTITGSGFQASQNNSTVTFNGVAATVTSWSNTQIVTRVPNGATTGPLLVTVNGVSSDGSTTFEVPNLALSSVTPGEAPGGGTITITGTGLGSSDLAVVNGNLNTVGFANLNGTAMSIVSWSSTSITAQLPPNAASGSLSVTRYGVTSNALAFTVEGPPTITAISPNLGPVGTTVTITGSGFGSTQSNSTVQFYGATAAVTSWSDTRIIATVPPGTATGSLNVFVGGVSGPGAGFIRTTTSQLTDSLGNVSTYTSEMIGGSWHDLSSTGSGCSSCTVRGTLSNTFDATGNVLTHTDELNHVTTFTYDANDNLTSQSQPLDSSNTVTTSYTYNSFGEPLTVTDPLGNVTTNTYDANGNLLTVTTPAPASGVAASVTQFAYDTKGELTRITDPLNNVTKLAYNSVGLISTITDAQNNVTSYGYDSHGNRTSVTDALNNQTTFAYDPGDRLTKITNPDQTFVTFAYDIRGRRTSVTDQNGKITSYGYDDADRLTSVTDAANNVTQYAYDTENNLLSITDANNHVTSFLYDNFGRVTKTTFPSTLSESYVYDSVGNLTNKTDRNNNSILYVYDALNRLTHKGYPDSTGVDYVYDLAGKIKQVTDPTGTYGTAYDNMGRLIGTTTQYAFVTGTPTFSNTYGYDAGSNRTSLTLPDSSTDTYQYDTLNRLAKITDSITGQFGFGYDGLSRRTQLTRPNGVNTNYGYDTLSRLLTVLHQTGTTTLDGATYTYDNAGNPSSKTNKLNGITEQYTYDPLYQLTLVTQGATTTESYSYDPVGNRLSSLGVSSYNYNSSNELTSNSAASFTYDNNGNTLTKTDSTGTRTYNWDFENRLASVALPGSGGTLTFKYDPFGRRIQKSLTQNSTTTVTNYLYEGANSIEELDASANELARYVQGNLDEPFTETRSGGSAFYEQDGLSSVTSLSGSSGAISNSYAYDTFGNIVASTGSLGNPFQYTGRDFDPETGLRYYRARYYDSTSGRFLSEDPTTFEGGINFYQYVDNNPTELSDPLGLAPKRRARPEWRECTEGEEARCVANCEKRGKLFESCRVPMTKRILRLKDGEVWADGPLSCSCKDRRGGNDCNREKLKRNSQPSKFELDEQEKANRYMVNFWEDILIGDIAIGIVGTAGALGVFEGVGAAAGGAGAGGAALPKPPIPFRPPAVKPPPVPISLRPAS